MPKCSQCDRLGLLAIEVGDSSKSVLPMCIHCYSIFVQANATQLDMQMRTANYLSDQMEHVAGLPAGLTPKYQLRNVIHMGNTILNNIKVDNSNIGVLNTGTIEGCRCRNLGSQ